MSALTVVAVSSVLCLTVGVSEATVEGLDALVADAKGFVDGLEVPDWLQGDDNSVARSRKRRFLDFPTGSTIAIKFTITVPTEGFSDSGSLVAYNTLTFNLPNTTDLDIFGLGRSDGSHYVGHTRNDLYKDIEEFLNGMGYDGHACTLRTICEVSEMPFEHGLIGEAINVMLSIATGPGSRLQDYPNDDYAIAEYYGKHHGHCDDIYNNCPVSVTNLLTKAIPDF